jgi:hypothetical protein
MSLFDVLRYPISEPPTKEELEALPNDIWDKWVAISQWPESASKTLIVEWYGGIDYTNLPSVEREIIKLKQIIKDYNGPI